MSAYTVEVRERVLAGVDEGLSHREVARRAGIGLTTVNNYLKMWRTTGSIVPRRHGGGSRKVLNDGDLAVLRELRAEDPTATKQVLAERLEERCGVRVSVGTIGRRLASMGITYNRRAHAPLVPRPSKPVVKPYAFMPASTPPDLPDRRTYPTDLTDAEWDILEPMIPKCKAGGRPEKRPRRELVNAMLYVLRNGNTWRALPHDFPPWSTVYCYFRKWRISGLWQKINDELRSQARRRAGRGLTPTAAVMDSQSAHTTEKGGLTAGTAISA